MQTIPFKIHVLHFAVVVIRRIVAISFGVSLYTYFMLQARARARSRQLKSSSWAIVILVVAPSDAANSISIATRCRTESTIDAIK